MTLNVFATPGDPSIGGSGGGPKPWWSFPTPLGPPKQQGTPGACYQGNYVEETGEWYYTQYPCAPLFPRTGIPGP